MVLGVLLAVVCVCVCVCGGTAVAAPHEEGGPSWSAAPSPPAGDANRSAEGDARSFFYLEGAPGTVLRDSLALTNRGDEPRTFRLRGADAYNARGGGFALRDEGRSAGAGTWIALARDTVEVPPRTRAEVPLSVTVPESAVPGDHPAAIVVSAPERTSGVRVHLRVSGPSLAALGIEDVSVTRRDDGAATLTYTLVNRGNTALRPRLTVRADGLFGRLNVPAPRLLPLELLPGQRVTRHEKWADPPRADLADVRLTATAGGGARDTATASYTALPWGWAAGLLLVAAAGGAGWCLRGRRRTDGAVASGGGTGATDGTGAAGSTGVGNSGDNGGTGNSGGSGGSGVVGGGGGRGDGGSGGEDSGPGGGDSGPGGGDGGSGGSGGGEDSGGQRELTGAAK